MKKTHEPLESGNDVAAVKKPAKSLKEMEDPCAKAFNQETSRLEDADEACDDGVR